MLSELHKNPPRHLDEPSFCAYSTRAQSPDDNSLKLHPWILAEGLFPKHGHRWLHIPHCFRSAELHACYYRCCGSGRMDCSSLKSAGFLKRLLTSPSRIRQAVEMLDEIVGVKLCNSENISLFSGPVCSPADPALRQWTAALISFSRTNWLLIIIACIV